MRCIGKSLKEIKSRENLCLFYTLDMFLNENKTLQSVVREYLGRSLLDSAPGEPHLHHLASLANWESVCLPLPIPGHLVSRVQIDPFEFPPRGSQDKMGY